MGAGSRIIAFRPSSRRTWTRLLRLKRQVADLIGYRTERYDALMDDFEPGMTSAEVGAIFTSLRGPAGDVLRGN